MRRLAPLGSRTRTGLAVLFSLCIVVLVAASAIGVRASTKLQDPRERAQLASDESFRDCLVSRLDKALPPGSRVAIVDTDPLWTQSLISWISPRVDVVKGARDAAYTLQLSGQLPGVPCRSVTIEVRRVP